MNFTWACFLYLSSYFFNDLMKQKGLLGKFGKLGYYCIAWHGAKKKNKKHNARDFCVSRLSWWILRIGDVTPSQASWEMVLPIIAPY